MPTIMISICLTLALMIFACGSASHESVRHIDSPVSESSIGRLTLLDSIAKRMRGEWMTRESIRRMTDKHSVYNMLMDLIGRRALYLRVDQDSAGCQFIVSFDLYDSGVMTFDSIETLPHGYKLADRYFDTATVYAFYQGFGDGEQIILHYSRPESPKSDVDIRRVDTFVRVTPSFQSFVNRIMLAGHYKDERGASVLLNEDGTGEWGRDSVYFETGTEFWDVMHSDYLKLSSTRHLTHSDSTTFGYKWSGRQLLIYPVHPGPGIPTLVIGKEPLHILTRLEDSK